MMDFWEITNQVSIMGMTIHLIDDHWSLDEHVLGVELVGSHIDQKMVDVFIPVLGDYNFQSKVKLGTLFFLLHVMYNFFTNEF